MEKIPKETQIVSKKTEKNPNQEKNPNNHRKNPNNQENNTQSGFAPKQGPSIYPRDFVKTVPDSLYANGGGAVEQYRGHLFLSQSYVVF